VELQRLQGRVDAGKLRRWRLERNVLPGGQKAECDYMSVFGYAGFPPEQRTELIEESLRGAGIRMTAAEFFAKRGAAAKAVRIDLYRSQALLGDSGKGSYRVFIRIQVLPGQMAGWTALSKETWTPYYAERIKDGAVQGYGFSTQMFPDYDGGFNAMSVASYESWEKLGKRGQLAETWAKTNPGKNFAEVQERLWKMAPRAKTEVYRTILMTQPAGGARGPVSGR
jgi:hypothetical protein